MEFILVRWPFSQEFMECDWFEEEAVLDMEMKHGDAAYFIPKERYDEFHKKQEKTYTFYYTMKVYIEAESLEEAREIYEIMDLSNESSAEFVENQNVEENDVPIEK